MERKIVAAIDVGGTSIKAALLDGDLSGVVSRRVPTARAEPGRAAAVLVDQLAELVAELQREAGVRIAAAGLAVPGVVDVDAGIGVFSANLGWRDAPIRDMTAQRLGVPIAFSHDVAAGAVAEVRRGAARGFTEVGFIAVGTGIAAPLIIDGRPRNGGELGHLDIGHGLLCACGATGCVEVIASASAITRRYAERSGGAPAGALDVVSAARAGDLDAEAVLREAIEALGKAVVALVRVVSPQVFVLGGGLFESGDYLLEPLRHWVSEHVVFQRAPELRVAELGDRAGCLGAGLLALDLLT